MTMHVSVGANILKARIEKAFATQEMQPAIDALEELLRHKGMELPCWMEGIIIERLRSVGIDVKKNGGWYRCIAAYALLPKMDELIEFEYQHTIFEENNAFEDENLIEQWFEIVSEAVSSTLNSIRSEFECLAK